MASPKQYTCKACDAAGEYIPPPPGDYTSRGVFRHLGAPHVGHDFEVKPQCPKCDSFNYAHYVTNWGHGDRCSDCQYDFYFSLGD